MPNPYAGPTQPLLHFPRSAFSIHTSIFSSFSSSSPLTISWPSPPIPSGALAPCLVSRPSLDIRALPLLTAPARSRQLAARPATIRRISYTTLNRLTPQSCSPASLSNLAHVKHYCAREPQSLHHLRYPAPTGVELLPLLFTCGQSRLREPHYLSISSRLFPTSPICYAALRGLKAS